MSDNIELFESNDFVFTQDQDGNIIGGGYKINSKLLQQGLPVMTTFNNEQQFGGQVSSSFENLAVPAGLFYVNMRIPNKTQNQYKPHETISDDIFDKLYSLIEVNKIKNKKKNTRRINKLTKTNKTRRT